MKPELPHILARYFAAQNAHDIDGDGCLLRAGCRRSRRRTRHRRHRRGPRLETGNQRKVSHHGGTARMHAVEDGRTIVVVKVSGTFDGSPAKLTYGFGFSGDGRIDALEVR